MLYICLCGFQCAAERGLTVHRKTCSITNVDQENSDLDELEDSDEEEAYFHVDDPAPVPMYDFGAPVVLPDNTKRTKRLPARFADFLPSTVNVTQLPTSSLPHLLQYSQVAVASGSNEVADDLLSDSPGTQDVSRQSETFTTTPNAFGLFRNYSRKPYYEPDEARTLDDVFSKETYDSNSETTPSPCLPPIVSNLYDPFPNASSFLITNWAVSGTGQKSHEEIDKLIQDVILNPDFKSSELTNYVSVRESARLDSSGNKPSRPDTRDEDGWKVDSVHIPMPAEKKHSRMGEERHSKLEVEGVYHRDIMHIIRTILADEDSSPIHYVPYREYWQPSETMAQDRVYGETYSCDAFLEAHEDVQNISSEDGVENVVLPLMLYSDSTHIGNFGNASLWPLYALLLGQSKYPRNQSTKSLCHHVAYIPALPSSCHDTYREVYGRSASAEVLTFMRRELMHSVLSLVLFGEDFRDAYTNGFYFDCNDGIRRRLFPRYLIYSADYPERMLVGSLRNMGAHPCADCLIQLKYVNALGTTADTYRRSHKRLDSEERRERVEKARKKIFNDGLGVESEAVKRIVREGSLVPVRNAFSVLADEGFNVFSMFAPDIMHEFELGVWKAAFTHLIRICIAQGGDTIVILNKRFRSLPVFGTGDIRRFTTNTAGMKKLAARDFEDILQCSLPVFDGLIKDAKHDKIISDLIYTYACWHAYAKLRIHTGSTLQSLEQATISLGQQARRFKKTTCTHYITREFDREVTARGRRQPATNPRNGSAADAKTTRSNHNQKEFNINTPKFHSIGGYVDAIRRFGTTDSYSTQIGETQHKFVKRIYGRTNKKNTARDISTIEGRQRALRHIKTRISLASSDTPVLRPLETIDEELPSTVDPSKHYQMSRSTKDGLHTFTWLQSNEGDSALENFYENLRSHLLSRLLLREEDSLTIKDFGAFRMKNDRIFRHSLLRIFYTSYDMQRCQDSINPKSHPDLMMINHGSEHPYTYARAIGIFHADCAYVPAESSSLVSYRSFDFVWVRWFTLDSSYEYGAAVKKLPRVSFMPHTEPDAFGFIDPDLILRAAYILPAFADGTTCDHLPSRSIARQLKDESNGVDYCAYSINIFADRDLFMRFRGGGIGHRSTWHLNDALRIDSQLSVSATGGQQEDEDVEEDVGNDSGGGSEPEWPDEESLLESDASDASDPEGDTLIS